MLVRKGLAAHYEAGQFFSSCIEGGKKSMDNKPRERKNKHHTDPYTGIELGGMVSLFFLKAMYKSATFTASSFCTVGYTCVVEDGRRRLVYILKL